MINAVISSTIPGLKLPMVLENTPNLTLVRLTQFLVAHYEQKIYFPEETVYIFVLRCLAFCQNILLVSEKSCGLSYSLRFIKKLFRRTIQRGIFNPFVVQEITPLLRSENIEVLLAANIKASTSKKEKGRSHIT